MPKGIKANGLRIAQARLALPDRPSQAEFARRVGIHWVTQSNIENNKANVSLELLERIAETTGKSRDHFLGEDDDEEAASMPPLTFDRDSLLDVLIEALQAARERGPVAVPAELSA